MWTDVIRTVVPVLGTLFAAGLVARVSTRRTAHLRAQSELWEALPDGPGKDELKAYLDERARAHVEVLRRADRDWTARALASADGTLLPLGVIAGAGVIFGAVGSGVFDVIGLVLLLVATVLAVWTIGAATAAALTRLARWSRNP